MKPSGLDLGVIPGVIKSPKKQKEKTAAENGGDQDVDGDGIFERGPESQWPSIKYWTAFCLLGCAGCLLVLPSPRPPRAEDNSSKGIYSEGGNDDETEALVSDAVSAEDNNKECQQEGSKGMQSLNADKPDTLAQSYPVVVCTVVVLCFYLGRSFETRLQQIHAH